jgi:hypothetical protein
MNNHYDEKYQQSVGDRDAKKPFKSSIADRVQKLMQLGTDEKNIPVLPDHRTPNKTISNHDAETKGKAPKIITKKIQTASGVISKNFLSPILGGDYMLLFDNDPSKNDSIAVNNSKVYRINGYTTEGVKYRYRLIY